jgi:hypothetical protein
MNNPNEEIKRIAEEAATVLFGGNSPVDCALTKVIESAIKEGIRAWAQREPSETASKIGALAMLENGLDFAEDFLIIVARDVYSEMLSQAIEELEGKP